MPESKLTRPIIAIMVAASTFILITAAMAKIDPPSGKTPDSGSEVRQKEMKDYKALADKAINPFGLEMYAKLERGDKNLVFSPLSVFAAMAIANEGARGQTKEEIIKALGIDKAAVPVGTTLGGLAVEIADVTRQNGGALHFANGLWIDKSPGRVLREDFRKIVEQDYGADIREAPFLKSPEKVAAEINNWVKEITQGKITDLISAEQLRGEQTVLSILNAVYFKSMWAWQFRNEDTKPADFTLADHSRIKVPMMHSSERFPYLDEKGFQAVMMPYKGLETSMIIFLPKRADGLQDFENSFTLESLHVWLKKFRHMHSGLQVFVPKFTFRSRLPLKSTLQSIGIESAFDLRAANLSGIQERPKTGLFITSVLHESWIEVNEKGTEAAAATHVPVAEAIPGPKMFRADHPFMFMIYHTRSGCILFIGRVTNPVAEKPIQ